MSMIVLIRRLGKVWSAGMLVTEINASNSEPSERRNVASKLM